MMKQLLTVVSAGIISLCMIGSVNATLIGRLPATLGGVDYQAYYDDALNITWMTEANSIGAVNWNTASSWAANLNIAGVTGWRLPTATPLNGISFNLAPTNNGSTDTGRNISRPGTIFAGSTSSELAHLFYNTLGNVSAFTAGGVLPTFSQCGVTCLENTGPFTNLQSPNYWTDSLISSGTIAFVFNGLDGFQGFKAVEENWFAWAVHDGDVASLSAVPISAAIWLFCSGFIGLIGVARRKDCA